MYVCMFVQVFIKLYVRCGSTLCMSVRVCRPLLGFYQIVSKALIYPIYVCMCVVCCVFVLLFNTQASPDSTCLFQLLFPVWLYFILCSMPRTEHQVGNSVGTQIFSTPPLWADTYPWVIEQVCARKVRKSRNTTVFKQPVLQVNFIIVPYIPGQNIRSTVQHQQIIIAINKVQTRRSSVILYKCFPRISDHHSCLWKSRVRYDEMATEIFSWYPVRRQLANLCSVFYLTYLSYFLQRT